MSLLGLSQISFTPVAVFEDFNRVWRLQVLSSRLISHGDTIVTAAAVVTALTVIVVTAALNINNGHVPVILLL